MRLRRRFGRDAHVPFHGGQCYACDAKATGLRDKRHERGGLEPACARHRDPSIKTFAACMYCNEPVRKGSASVDGQHAHKSCHREAAQ